MQVKGTDEMIMKEVPSQSSFRFTDMANTSSALHVWMSYLSNRENEKLSCFRFTVMASNIKHRLFMTWKMKMSLIKRLMGLKRGPRDVLGFISTSLTHKTYHLCHILCCFYLNGVTIKIFVSFI